jgi:hypothetical protein
VVQASADHPVSEKEAAHMKQRIKYTDEPMEFTVIPDFLPPPEKLRFKEKTARMTYESKKDVLHLRLSNASVSRTVKADAGVILEYDDLDNLTGLRLLKASRLVANPKVLEFAVA